MMSRLGLRKPSGVQQAVCVLVLLLLLSHEAEAIRSARLLSRLGRKHHSSHHQSGVKDRIKQFSASGSESGATTTETTPEVVPIKTGNTLEKAKLFDRTVGANTHQAKPQGHSHSKATKGSQQPEATETEAAHLARSREPPKHSQPLSIVDGTPSPSAEQDVATGSETEEELAKKKKASESRVDDGTSSPSAEQDVATGSETEEELAKKKKASESRVDDGTSSPSAEQDVATGSETEEERAKKKQALDSATAVALPPTDTGKAPQDDSHSSSASKKKDKDGVEDSSETGSGGIRSPTEATLSVTEKDADFVDPEASTSGKGNSVVPSDRTIVSDSGPKGSSGSELPLSEAAQRVEEETDLTATESSVVDAPRDDSDSASASKKKEKEGVSPSSLTASGVGSLDLVDSSRVQDSTETGSETVDAEALTSGKGNSVVPSDRTLDSDSGPKGSSGSELPLSEAAQRVEEETDLTATESPESRPPVDDAIQDGEDGSSKKDQLEKDKKDKKKKKKSEDEDEEDANVESWEHKLKTMMTNSDLSETEKRALKVMSQSNHPSMQTLLKNQVVNPAEQGVVVIPDLTMRHPSVIEGLKSSVGVPALDEGVGHDVPAKMDSEDLTAQGLVAAEEAVSALKRQKASLDGANKAIYFRQSITNITTLQEAALQENRDIHDQYNTLTEDVAFMMEQIGEMRCRKIDLQRDLTDLQRVLNEDIAETEAQLMKQQRSLLPQMNTRIHSITDAVKELNVVLKTCPEYEATGFALKEPLAELDATMKILDKSSGKLQRLKSDDDERSSVRAPIEENLQGIAMMLRLGNLENVRRSLEELKRAMTEALTAEDEHYAQVTRVVQETQRQRESAATEHTAKPKSPKTKAKAKSPTPSSGEAEAELAEATVSEVSATEKTPKKKKTKPSSKTTPVSPVAEEVESPLAVEKGKKVVEEGPPSGEFLELGASLTKAAARSKLLRSVVRMTEGGLLEGTQTAVTDSYNKLEKAAANIRGTMLSTIEKIEQVEHLQSSGPRDVGLVVKSIHLFQNFISKAVEMLDIVKSEQTLIAAELVKLRAQVGNFREIAVARRSDLKSMEDAVCHDARVVAGAMGELVTKVNELRHTKVADCIQYIKQDSLVSLKLSFEAALSALDQANQELTTKISAQSIEFVRVNSDLDSIARTTKAKAAEFDMLAEDYIEKCDFMVGMILYSRTSGDLVSMIPNLTQAQSAAETEEEEEEDGLEDEEIED